MKYIKPEIPEVITDDFIIDYFYTFDKLGRKRINGHRNRNIDSRLLEYLDNRYPDSTCLKETLMRILYHIEERPVCKICGKPVYFRGHDEHKIFDAGCCKEHSDLIRKNSIHEQCLKKYGVDNVFQLSEVKEKIVDYNMSHYGVKNFTQTEEYKQKSSETNLKKYGATNVFGSEYGKQKIKEYWQKNYGVNHGMQVPEIKEKCFKNIESSIKKGWSTKKKNHTTNTSIPEEQIYNMLVNIFGKDDIKRLYNQDSRYPFSCDFYIISIDMFIEYLGTWFHGKHPYDSNNEEDILLVKEWQDKYDLDNKKKSYKSAIYVFTQRDVMKRNIAKQNNLNYIELFNMQEVKIFLDNLI